MSAAPRGGAPGPDGRGRLPRPLLVTLGAVAALALLVVAACVVTGTPLLEEQRFGVLLDTTDTPVHEIRVLGVLDVYVEQLTFRGADVVPAIALAFLAGGCLAFAAGLLAIGGPAGRRSALLFGLAGLGTLYLAADETAGLHELIGHTLGESVGTLPGFERMDDAVFAFYVLPTLAFLWVFRRDLLASRPAVGAMAVTLVVFVLLMVVDTLGRGPETLLEVATGSLMVVTFAVLAQHHLRAALRARPAAA